MEPETEEMEVSSDIAIEETKLSSELMGFSDAETENTNPRPDSSITVNLTTTEHNSIRQETVSPQSNNSSNEERVQSTTVDPDGVDGDALSAKNYVVDDKGNVVILWTRETDRLILTTCQKDGTSMDVFNAIASQLGNKTAEEVRLRLDELLALYALQFGIDDSYSETTDTDSETM